MILLKKVLSSRLQNFIDAKNACDKVVEELEASKVYKDVNGKEIKAGDFVKDLSTEDSEPCKVIENEGELAVNVDGTTVYFSEIETEKVCEIVDMKAEEPYHPKPKEDSSKAEAKKTDKEKQPKEKIAKTARKVGDVHPKHPTWVWTEYKPGKFDWRADKSFVKNNDTKEYPKNNNSDVNKNVDEKSKKDSKIYFDKAMNIDEFISALAGKKLSDTQKYYFKLLKKGWRIVKIDGAKFFQNDNDGRKSCNWEAVVAMLSKVGITEIPVGLIKE